MPQSDSTMEICDVRIAGKETVSNLFGDRQRFKRSQVDNSVKNRLASQALELLIDFEMALSERKRKYPVQEFFAFARAARRYIDLTRKDQLDHNSIMPVCKGPISPQTAQVSQVRPITLMSRQRVSATR
jgi:hypothetical protein